MKKLAWKVALLVIGACAALAAFVWAYPRQTDIVDGYSLFHFRGSGGMTYVVDQNGIKLAGPKINELEVTDAKIVGLGGQDGATAFSIDRATGFVTHFEGESE